MLDDTPKPSAIHLRSLVLKGGSFLFARQVASMGLSFLGVLIVTRIIGPEAYGSYTSALGLAQFLQNLAQLGAGTFLIRHATELNEQQYRTAWTFLLVTSAALSLTLFGAADYLSAWLRVPGFASLLRAIVLFMPLQALATVAGTRMERDLNFRQSALIELTSQMSYYAVAIPTAFAGYGAWALIFGWTTQQITYCVLIHIAAKHRPAFSWDETLVRRLVKYSLSFSIANWVLQARSLINPLIVGHYLGAESVAYVQLTIRLLELLGIVKTITWRLSVAAFAKIQTQPEKLLRAISEAMQLQTLAIGTMLLGFSWVGGKILLLVTGDRWAPVLDLFPFLAASYLMSAQFNMHVSALQVLHRNIDVGAFALLNVSLFAASSAIAIPKLGLLGYGWAELVAIPSYLLLRFYVSRAIGQVDYRLPFMWWTGIGMGLFWRQLGYGAFSAPFIALVLPESRRKIKAIVRMLLEARRG